MEHAPSLYGEFPIDARREDPVCRVYLKKTQFAYVSHCFVKLSRSFFFSDTGVSLMAIGDSVFSIVCIVILTKRKTTPSHVAPRATGKEH